jgi:uncharacterized phage-like protein YoqJ
MPKGCSFTGHRQINMAHKDRIGDMLTRAINYAYNEGCRDFLTGGALGFDTLAAREVIRFRQTHQDVRLILCLPCIDQANNWSDHSRSAYEHILTSSDEVIYVSEEYTDGCMRERNRLLAEKCDILIAYCARAKSGSGQTIRIAESLGKRVFNIYSALDKA